MQGLRWLWGPRCPTISQVPTRFPGRMLGLVDYWDRSGLGANGKGLACEEGASHFLALGWPFAPPVSRAVVYIIVKLYLKMVWSLVWLSSYIVSHAFTNVSVCKPVALSCLEHIWANTSPTVQPQLFLVCARPCICWLQLSFPRSYRLHISSLPRRLAAATNVLNQA